MINDLDRFKQQMADFQSHHIEGWLTSEAGGGQINVPIVSHIEGNLWSGGTPADAGGDLPEFFKYVLCLYPWEKYTVAEGTEVKNVKLYDSSDGVDGVHIDTLARWVNERVEKGPTLVHCQAGINRSSLVAARSLMLRLGMSGEEAIQLLSEKRSPMILSNPVFRKWLRSQK